MLRTWHTPRTADPPAVARAEHGSVPCESATWTPDTLAHLATALAHHAPALTGLSDRALLAAWTDTVAAFRDPGSAERRALDPALAATTRLSPQGLAAGLEAVLGGVAGEHAERVVERAADLRRAAGDAGPPAPPSPALVILASNLPALAVQPLLPLLALRRPALLKSPSAEPLFAPAFLAALAHREPALGESVAAVAWPGGDADLEAPLLAAAGRVLAYGDAPALDDLRRRAPGKVIGHGPRTSLAVLGTGVDTAAAAAGLARDVALFDQRGCLSVAAVYLRGHEGDARRFATCLATELAHVARRWPPGPATTAERAAVRQVRDEAVAAGAWIAELPPAGGTVIADPRPAFRPTPGRRTVRVIPLADLGELPQLLIPWDGRLQGVAHAGALPSGLRDRLAGLGVSRFAAPGELQSADTRWHNGGLDPLEVLRA